MWSTNADVATSGPVDINPIVPLFANYHRQFITSASFIASSAHKKKNSRHAKQKAIYRTVIGRIILTRIRQINCSSGFSCQSTGSQKGKPLLIQRLEYCYVIARQQGETTYWRCSTWTSSNRCQSTVMQKDEKFIVNRHQHSHLAILGRDTAATVRVVIKQKALADVFHPATSIVEEACVDHVKQQACPALPSIVSNAWTVNRARQSARPQEPINVDFQICYKFMNEGFLRADLQHKGRCHLIFITEQSLSLLAKAKSSYVEETFAVVGMPFYQFFSIHASVASSYCCKQVRLVF